VEEIAGVAWHCPSHNEVRERIVSEAAKVKLFHTATTRENGRPGSARTAFELA
jgi:hypothetical protein